MDIITLNDRIYLMGTKLFAYHQNSKIWNPRVQIRVSNTGGTEHAAYQPQQYDLFVFVQNFWTYIHCES